MEDEISTLGAVIGAVWAGMKGMTATSGPGFSPDAGTHRLCSNDRNTLVIVNMQRALRHRTAHHGQPGGYDAGPLGIPGRL
jgi:pyruvate/2-oxoacid:ferredoxin oxidoreductase alpha subunit